MSSKTLHLLGTTEGQLVHASKAELEENLLGIKEDIHSGTTSNGQKQEGFRHCAPPDSMASTGQSLPVGTDKLT